MPGSMVAEEIRLPDGSCEEPEYPVEVEGNSRVETSITTITDRNCNVWVGRIDWQANP